MCVFACVFVQYLDCNKNVVIPNSSAGVYIFVLFLSIKCKAEMGWLIFLDANNATVRHSFSVQTMTEQMLYAFFVW